MSLGPHDFSLLIHGTALSLAVIIVLAMTATHRTVGNAATKTLQAYGLLWLAIIAARFVARIPPDTSVASSVTVWATIVVNALGGLVPLMVLRLVDELNGATAQPLTARTVLLGALLPALGGASVVAVVMWTGRRSTVDLLTISRWLPVVTSAIALGIVVFRAAWRGAHRRAFLLLSAMLVGMLVRPAFGPTIAGQLAEQSGTLLQSQLTNLAVTSVLVAIIALATFALQLEIVQAGVRESEEWVTHAEREIMVSSAEQDQGRLAAGLAHDVGNVLHVITLVASQLEQRAPLEPWLRLTALAERGRMLVHRMLDVARAVPTELRDTDLVRCVEGLLPVLSRLAPAHRVEVLAPAHPVMARADAEAVERILMELVRNAAHHGPAGSRITIAVGDGAAEAESGAITCVTVRDEGGGIARSHLPEPAPPGAPTDVAAVGTLGLPTYRALARSMGGELKIARADASGSELRLCLPAVAP